MTSGGEKGELRDIDEVELLRKKLNLKTEALMILTQELEQCRNQRDQFKLMAEGIQERFWHFKKQVNDTKELRKYSLDGDFRLQDFVTELREQNKCLKLQVEALRQKLLDAQGDIKVLRRNNHSQNDQNIPQQLAPAIHEREEMISHLERMNVKCTQLQTDLQTVLDEKHELEMERDAFKCKSHRLNHELSKALSASQPVDLDSLINENRYLQDRLQQLLEEKELARQSLSKYKGMLDSKRIKGTIKLGGTAGTIMTLKQVEQLLQNGVSITSNKSSAAVSDLRSLCSGLLDALNDKTLALAHQKKANKILASRICELDNAVPSPTDKLLEGYAGANVDDDDVEVEVEAEVEDGNWEKKIFVESKGVEEGEGGPQMESRGLQMGLPQNLEVLVQKALVNLRESDKDCEKS